MIHKLIYIDGSVNTVSWHMTEEFNKLLTEFCEEADNKLWYGKER